MMETKGVVWQLKKGIGIMEYCRPEILMSLMVIMKALIFLLPAMRGLFVSGTSREYLGFDMYTDSVNVEAGDWFIIDYNATSVGICEVRFYDHTYSWSEPNYCLMFSHVRTRDFNNDTIVNFADFALLASYWQQTNCGDVNDCGGTDLDINGKVDVNDLMLFTDYWLYKTE